MDIDNPAARLHAIFLKFKAIKKSTTVIDAWSQVFEVEKNDFSQILKLQADVTEQLRLVRSQVNRIKKIKHDIYLQPIGIIEEAMLQASFYSGVDAYHSKINAILDKLEFCSDLLSREMSEGWVTNDKLNGLLSAAGQLKDKIDQLEGLGKAKQLLSSCLDDYRYALKTYEINGVFGIHKAFEGIVGRLNLKTELRQTLTNDSQGKAVLVELLESFNQFNAAIESDDEDFEHSKLNIETLIS